MWTRNVGQCMLKLLSPKRNHVHKKFYAKKGGEVEIYKKIYISRRINCV